MASQTNKVRAKLTSLNTSLGELESLLEPLLAQSLSESTLELEPLQKAKLQTVLPYVAYDLIFIYLKTKGVDPKTHPVISELDRVRQYFEKIANAEKSPTRRVEVDREAAGRFIKHAIAQAIPTPTVNPHPTIPLPSTSIPAKITTKMVARAQYEAALKRAHEEQGGEEQEEELEVYDEPQSDSDSNSGSPTIIAATSSLAEVGPVASTSLKRRRAPVDPFAGYGEEDTTATEPSRKQPRHPSRNSQFRDLVQSKTLGLVKSGAAWI